MAPPVAGAGGPRGCDAAPDTVTAGFEPERLQACLDAFSASTSNFHALVIERGGALVAERYRRGRDQPLGDAFARTTTFDNCHLHDVRSISKSVTALLWGIADAQGKTPPLSTQVFSLYPELTAFATNGREAITLQHLFTMSSGLEWDEENYAALNNDEFPLYFRSSQARHALDRPLAQTPGTVFNYNGGLTAIIADLLVRFTGMSLPAFAQENLFTPLGISHWEWRRDYRGRPVAFAGLRLTPRDMAAIGRLVLARGQWDGRQIVPAAWVDESTRAHVETGDGLSYGYFWWLGRAEAMGQEHDYIAGFGNGGQRLFIVPGLDLTVAITAGNYNMPAGRLSRALFTSVLDTINA